MKHLSRWAQQHPHTSIALIIFLHVLAGLNATVLGSQLFVQDWVAPRWLVLIFVHLFFLAYFFYPRKKASRWSLSYSYYRQKALDFTLVLAASLTIVFGVSRMWTQLGPATPAAEASFINYQPATKKNIESSKRVAQLKLRAQAKKMRKELRKVRKKLKKQDTRSSRDTKRFLWIFLGISLAILLALVIAGLSCTIACSGQEGLALVVLIGGWAGIIWLFVIGIKHLNRKLPRIKPPEQNI